MYRTNIEVRNNKTNLQRWMALAELRKLAELVAILGKLPENEILEFL